MSYIKSTELVSIKSIKSTKISTLIGDVICLGHNIQLESESIKLQGEFNLFETNDLTIPAQFVFRKNQLLAFHNLENNILYIHPLFIHSAKWDLFLISIITSIICLALFTVIYLFTFNLQHALNTSLTFALIFSPVILIFGLNGYYKSSQTFKILKAMGYNQFEINIINNYTPNSPGIYPLNEIFR